MQKIEMYMAGGRPNGVCFKSMLTCAALCPIVAPTVHMMFNTDNNKQESFYFSDLCVNGA